MLDNRTTPRCQALDSTYHLLSEYSPGTNAPPMHPRCRSTIAAVLGEKTGTRIARNSKGENIQVPASMNYSEYKRVYLDSGLKNGNVNGKIPLESKGVSVGAYFISRTLTTPIMTVAESKSFAEFQIYWAENYNVRVSDEIKNLDFKAVKTASQGIEAVLKEFPSVVPLLKEFRVNADNNIMSVSYLGQISFNRNYFNNFNELETLADKAAKSGFRPKNTGIREYGAHEAGHILELALIRKYGGNIENWKKNIYSLQIISKAYDNIKTATPKSIFNLRNEISGYATLPQKTGECLAEAIADYIANGENSAILSIEIWKILKKELE